MHYPLKFHCNKIRNECENGSRRALPSKHHISHCIILNETQITMHFFQGRFSAMPEITAGLFLAISKTGTCLLILSCFERFTVFGSKLAKVSKKLVLGLFLKVS